MRNLARIIVLLLVVVTASTAFAQSSMPAAGKNLIIGLVMVGPFNDQGFFL